MFIRALTGTLLALCLAASAQAARPNIVFILADDLGFNDVGWRNPEVHSPHIDALARGGAVLEHFYVMPVCSPTRGSLMTGRYPLRYGLQTGVVRPWADYGLPLEERTLAAALKQAGYETAISGKWHLGTIEPGYLPTRRGFDHQYGHYNGAIDYFKHDRDGGHDWHKDDKASYDEGYSTDLLGKEAARLIESQPAGKPLFLYVPFNAVHTPLQVPDSYLARFASIKDQKRKLYLAMMAAMDDAVGRIVAAIDKKGIRNNTLIIFSSDNGGPTGSGATNTPLRAGKGTLYEGGTRVAAFVNWPGVIASGGRIDGLMHMVDWFPTLVKLAGGTLEGSRPLDGVDNWAMIAQGKPSARTEMVYNAEKGRGAVRIGEWKLVRTAADFAQDGEGETHAAPAGKNAKKAGKKKAGASSDGVELFNLAADPNETTNLAKDNPRKVAELAAKLDEATKQAVPAKGGAAPKGYKAPKVWGEK